MRSRVWMVIGALLASEPVAEACTCASVALTRPEDGAIHVPLNARLLLFGAGVRDAQLRRRDDAANVVLAIEDSEGSYPFESVLARPLVGLDADTAYEVVLERIPEDVVVSTFTTGTTRDDVAPALAGATGIRAERWQADGTFYNSCWGRADGTDQVLVDHDVYAPDVAGVVVEVRREGDAGPPWRTIHPVPFNGGPWGGASGVTRLISGSCSPTGAPPLDEPGSSCARVTAFDLAGNVAGGSAEVCGPNVTCRLDRELEEVLPTSACEPIPFPTDAMPDGGGTSAPDAGTSVDAAGSPTDGGGGGGCAIGPGRNRVPANLTFVLILVALALLRRRSAR